jgi:hypothetical protein
MNETAGVPADVSIAIQLFAQSHGMSVDEAVQRIAAGAEVLAERLVAVCPSKKKALAFIAKCEAEKTWWTVGELAVAAGVHNGSQMLKVLRREGFVRDGEREVHTKMKSPMVTPGIRFVSSFPTAK